MMNISNNPKSLNSHIKFSGSLNPATVGQKFLNRIDFFDSNTSRKAVMWLYTGCILARLANSRDKYEFKETLYRDSMGWMSLFFAASLCERFAGAVLEKVSKRKGEAVSLFLAPKGKEAFPGIWNVIKPRSGYVLRSFEDIEPLKDSKLYKSILKNKSIAYLSSLVFAIAVIGIGIPKLNVITTRHQVKNNKSKVDKTSNTANNTQQVSNSGNKLTMEDFLKKTMKA